jgi:DNA-binding NtrC family response regulator
MSQASGFIHKSGSPFSHAAPITAPDIIGHHPSMKHIMDLIQRSAQAFSTVLLLGESGTGKELVARAIHQNSPRGQGPFVTINCAAMPASLAESELFGHEKGAFTDAHERRVGKFESAAGGTLLIDEIGDLDISLQVKLLRVLESRIITPVGSNKEIKVDTRVLAATSRNLQQMMFKGEFREDLYYRLNVITIDMPPLRERLDDIPLLVERFIQRVNQQNGTRITRIDPAVMDILQRYSWPGNVRELLHVLEGAMVLAEGEVLQVEELPESLRKCRSPAPAALRNAAGEIEAAIEQVFSTMTMAELENRAIMATLRRCHENRTHAAESLNISVRTLQRKLLTMHAVDVPRAVEAESLMAAVAT